MKKQFASGATLGLCILLFSMFVFDCPAEIPEPDNVIFGAVVRDGVPVTATDTDVTVQIRRGADEVIASYQMGSNPRLGYFYAIRVPLESLNPKLEAGSTQTGDPIYLVVSDAGGDFATTNLVVSQRGAFQRVDLGAAANPDADGDGLPDAWELARNGTLNQNGNSDPDGDGRNNRQEYVAGTNPNDANDVFRLFITQPAGATVVSFFAQRAEGAGYEGSTRYYSLESTTNLATGTWLGIPGRTNMPGNNTTVTHQPTGSAKDAYYRTRLSLERP